MAASDHNEDIPLVERVIEATLFRPFEVAAQLAAVPPREVSSRVRQVRNDVRAARMLGKFAVDYGVRRLRAEVAARVENDSDVRATPPRSDGGAVAPVAENDRIDEQASAVAPPPDTDDAVEDEGSPDPSEQPAGIDPEQLALPDYDSLSAADIVGLLGALTQHERDAVEEYESANRRRRTVLGKLDQLRAEP